MENKNIYILIGQICGLRKATFELEKRVAQLKHEVAQDKADKWYDDGSQSMYERSLARLAEAEDAFESTGNQYGIFKCWFNHNHNEFFKEELKVALKIIEMEFKGNSESHLDTLLSYLEVMANDVLIEWEQLKKTANFEKAQSQPTIEISMAYFEKNFKAEFFKTHEDKILSLNAYLEKNNKKKVLKDTVPRKATELCEYLLNLKETLLANKVTLQALKEKCE